MFNKLKQIKDLRDQAKKLQSSLSEESVEGSAAWGKVTIKMNGNQEIIDINIDPEFLDPNKKSKLESALKEAFADCLKKIQKVMVTKMKTSGISLPDLNK